VEEGCGGVADGDDCAPEVGPPEFEGGGGAGLIVRSRPLGGARAVIPASAWTRTTPCPADFNNTGGLTVQDIFDFLGAWFAGQPAADFNGVNGLSVQDIFDFLAAWFAGC